MLKITSDGAASSTRIYLDGEDISNKLVLRRVWIESGSVVKAWLEAEGVALDLSAEHVGLPQLSLDAAVLESSIRELLGQIQAREYAVDELLEKLREAD